MLNPGQLDNYPGAPFSAMLITDIAEQIRREVG